MVWLGPAISTNNFLIGKDVYQAFVARDQNAAAAFTLVEHDKWLADIYLLARQRLQKCGIGADAIYGGEFCTYNDAQNFFSYRRDSKITGRMASLIWLG
jgi:polyphenol oxidase